MNRALKKPKNAERSGGRTAGGRQEKAQRKNLLSKPGRQFGNRQPHRHEGQRQKRGVQLAALEQSDGAVMAGIKGIRMPNRMERLA